MLRHFVPSRWLHPLAPLKRLSPVDLPLSLIHIYDASMKGFLNFMAQCTPQSTRNLLILYEQDPTITHPRTFDKWKAVSYTHLLFIAPVLFARLDGNRIPNQMIVDMPGVQVGADDHLIFAAQQKMCIRDRRQTAGRQH